MADVIPACGWQPGAAALRGSISGLGLIAALALLAPAAAAAETLGPEALQRFVHQDCGSCHGLQLKGGLGPEITPEAMQHYDREILVSVILDGVEDTPMPPWRPLLTQEEAERIADYLLSGEMK